MTKIPKGELLENIVAAAIPGGYRTKGSGSVHHEGDVRSKSGGITGDFIFECKFRDKPNFILPKDTIEKSVQECLPRGKMPAWVLWNGEEEPIACLRLDDLANLLSLIEHYEESTNG
jgi:hypothetical protein